MTRSELIKSISKENPFISNQDLICKVLISEILTMKLKCGDHLSQNKLSTDFNLSRGPVKLALEKMESHGKNTSMANLWLIKNVLNPKEDSF